MGRWFVLSLWLALTGLAVRPAIAGPPPGEASGQRVTVVASIFPLADVAGHIGGDAVRIETLLPADASPHDFEPKPGQAEALARADLLLTVGFGLDLWAQRLADASGNRQLAVLSLADFVVPGESAPSHPGDPHAWLDPMLMGEFTVALQGAFTAFRPQEAAGIRDRAIAYREELLALDQEYRERLAGVKSRAFVCLHAAFSYIADRYGLEQAAVFESHMEEPGPGELERTVEFIRRRGIHVLFIQPQMPASSATWLREQSGLRIATLDPLGSPLRPGYDSYLALMRSNLTQLVSALGE